MIICYSKISITFTSNFIFILRLPNTGNFFLTYGAAHVQTQWQLRIKMHTHKHTLNMLLLW